MIRKVFRHGLKLLVSPFLQWSYKNYSEKDHKIVFYGLDIIVAKQVFDPGFFFSTKFLVEFLKTLNLQNKSVLELGCGTGALSCWMATQGAEVTASDLNPNAVANAKLNAERNSLEIVTIQSNLFEKLNDLSFDMIVVNPPYYPKKREGIADHAWFCGENFEYFQEFFNQLNGRSTQSQVFMVLSEDCDLQSIKKIAIDYKYNLNTVKEASFYLEKNFIYDLKRVI